MRPPWTRRARAMVIADDSAGAGLRVAIATAACLDGAVDVSTRADADVAFDPHGELPFEDRAVSSIALGDAVVELSPRDQLQLLAECRRVLAAGAELRLVEPEARAVHGQLSHWAELVGLAPLPAQAQPRRRDGAAGVDRDPCVQRQIFRAEHR